MPVDGNLKVRDTWLIQKHGYRELVSALRMGRKIKEDGVGMRPQARILVFRTRLMGRPVLDCALAHREDWIISLLPNWRAVVELMRGLIEGAAICQTVEADS